MGTISDKTTYLNTTKTKIREKINDLGQDLDEEDTFRSYAEALEQVWNEYPKVTATDVEEATLNGTKKGRMNIDLKGNTEQTQLTGANLLKFNTRSASSAGVDYVCNDKGEVTLTGPSTASTGFGYNQSGNEVVLKTGTYKFKVIGNFDDVTFRRTDTDSLITIDNNGEGTINITEDNTSLRIVIYRTTGVTYNSKFRLTLASGSTATTEYYCGGIPSPSPNFPQTIHNVSGNNNIKIQNKNLALNDNIENPDANYESSGAGSAAVQYNSNESGYYSTTSRQRIFQVKNNETVTLSCYAKSSGSSNRIYLYKYNIETGEESFISNLFPSTTITNIYERYSKTINMTENYNAIKAVFYSNIFWKDIQLEQGSTATTYVEHEEQNLPFTFAEGQRAMQGTEIKDDGIHHIRRRIEITNENVDQLVYDLQNTYAIPCVRILKTALGWKSGWASHSALINRYHEILSSSDLVSGAFAEAFQMNYFIILDERFTDLATAKNLLIGTVIECKQSEEWIEPFNETQQAQYNAIKKAMSSDGQTNISQTNDDLPFKLDITALKNS